MSSNSADVNYTTLHRTLRMGNLWQPNELHFVRLVGHVVQLSYHIHYKNVRENGRGNHEWTIQRNWQHLVHKTQDEDKQSTNTQTENCKDE